MQLMYRLWQLTHLVNGTPIEKTWILSGQAKVTYAQGFDKIQVVLRKLYEKDQLHKAGE